MALTPTAEMVKDIAETASKFRSSIVIQFEGKMVDAKSLLGLFTVLPYLASYRLQILGADQEEAKVAMYNVMRKYDLKSEMVSE